MKLYKICLCILFLVAHPTSFAALPVAEVNPDDTTMQNGYKNTYNLDSVGKCEIYDPLEKLNRKIYKFNSVVDYIILRPIAKTYDKVTSNYIKARVGSFISNVTTPLTIVNYGLQMDGGNSLKGVWRFIINTTFGIGGLFDVASKMGIEVKSQTFGNTLARYGVAPGPYIVLPLLGSTNMRDITDPILTNDYLNPLTYSFHRDARLIFTGGRIIHERASILPLTDYIMENSLDPYIAVRSSVHQNREAGVSYPKNFICPK